ncbi:hypothetical protein BCR32DRAFT_249524 [Anaeromyces robustus]|uniref:Uncharacterized protein n=1 Tax=Anaeromyces robustus TaxID=1754192 RepID=A0A1Y1WPM8_9FUNG|nr:hypothetical protein BCR32DRAFT_249524 [Anaeromyces robustus]|eukprot:ORX75497.1 hypothetical protein BCR32DRAFT_249524 [Anaeromyces robustus]
MASSLKTVKRIAYFIILIIILHLIRIAIQFSNNQYFQPKLKAYFIISFIIDIILLASHFLLIYGIKTHDLSKVKKYQYIILVLLVILVVKVGIIILFTLLPYEASYTDGNVHIYKKGRTITWLDVIFEIVILLGISLYYLVEVRDVIKTLMNKNNIRSIEEA